MAFKIDISTQGTVLVQVVSCFCSFVELNRSASLEPESLPKPKKSPFVRQKLTVSVGEIINGGPLPLMTHHVPMCSFNGQNKYTGESATVDAASSGQKTSLDFPGETELAVSQFKGGGRKCVPRVKNKLSRHG